MAISLLAPLLALAAPPLEDLGDLCSLDHIYDKIQTGKVVDVDLTLRTRDCPNNIGNQPCGVPDLKDGYPRGPLEPLWLDGVRSMVVTVNDASPGPAVHVNLGDTVRVTVHNYIGEPTSMHFHGVTQFRTPYMDGDEMISNCPIQTGHSFTYEFVAHPAGTTWYHAHSAGHRIAGVYGAFIVHNPHPPFTQGPAYTGPAVVAAGSPPPPSSLDQVVVFADWWHQDSTQNFHFWAQNTPGDGCITFGGRYTGVLNGKTVGEAVGAVVGDGIFFQSVLVNGKGVYHHDSVQVPKVYNNNNQSGLGKFDYQQQLCPGQSYDPPPCAVCLDPVTLESTYCIGLGTDANDGIGCGQVETFTVDPGSTTRLRLVHAGSMFAMQVCIDGHSMKVVSADGFPVNEHATDCIILNPAERYDVLVEANAPSGVYKIRFTTLEQTLPNAGTDGSPGFTSGSAITGAYSPGLPNQGFAVLKYAGAGAAFGSRSPLDPPACDPALGPRVNCGPEYWKEALTLGCAMQPSDEQPSRCTSVFSLTAAHNDDKEICGEKKLAHEAKATVSITTPVSFLPDEVPRYQNFGLASRMDIIGEEHGWPYVIPDSNDEWADFQPVAFVNPKYPPLSLDAEDRDALYEKRTTFRESEQDGAPYLGPDSTVAAYPPNFAKGVHGTNALSVKYGDVVRIFINCTAPYGPGCAMTHPMHLHGHKMAVLAMGKYDEPVIESQFSKNPVYRDVVPLYTDGWFVVQFVANNPGVWRFHCHVSIHLRSGMAMLFDVGGSQPGAMALRATPDEHNLCGAYEDDKCPSGPTKCDAESECSDGTSCKCVVDSGHSRKLMFASSKPTTECYCLA